MWWLEDSEELSATARDILNEAEERAEKHRVCAVTFWELNSKEVRGQMQPNLGVEFWPALLADLTWLEIEKTSVFHLASDGGTPMGSPRSRGSDHRGDRPEIRCAGADEDERFHRPDSPVKAGW